MKVESYEKYINPGLKLLLVSETMQSLVSYAIVVGIMLTTLILYVAYSMRELKREEIKGVRE
jgi:multisubunit Na+/H+ antiporter MnhC subunit